MPRLIMNQQECYIAMLSFSVVVIVPKGSMSRPTSRKVIFCLINVDYLTNFALGCVNSVVVGCKILFEEKFSLSSLDTVYWMDH